MIKKLCIFTINFGFDRQRLINFLENSLSKEVELFLFVPNNCKEKYYTKRAQIVETKSSKYLSFFELRAFCKKNEIERIFSMGALPQEGFVMAFASAFTKTRTLCHLVVNPFTAYKTGFNKHAIKAFFEYLLLYPLILMIDKFYIAIKGEIYKKSIKTFSLAKNKIEVLTYPLDSNFFIPKDKTRVRKKLGFPTKQKIILYVGRIEYEKGSDILLDLAKINKDIQFLLIGQLFDNKLKEANLRNLKIISPQNSQTLLDYYNVADLCIFPSRSEAGPSTAREAMSCGTQVILPDIMGPRALCPPAIKSPINPTEITEEIEQFFKTPLKDRKKLSMELRKFVVKEYSYDSCKKIYNDKLLD